MSDTANHKVALNGVNAATGDYLVPPQSARDVVQRAQAIYANAPLSHAAEDLQRQIDAELRARRDDLDPNSGKMRPVPWIDERDLAQTGWGVIFARNADLALIEALRPLLDWRREQATRHNTAFYQEFSAGRGYLPNDTKWRWTARHGAGGGGAVDPEQGIPYYLLLVGGPDAIPYEFQYALDVQYAVGRIAFDTLEEYSRYALSVVRAEQTQLTLPRRAVFWGVANNDDPATQLSAEQLIAPLPERLGKRHSDWELARLTPEQSTKQQLKALLGGDQTPALLFTASHGLGFPKDHPLQRIAQGALLCQDWPGPLQWKQPLPPDFYMAASDVGDDAQLWGTIACFFACFGAGTPRYDDYWQQSGKRQELASNSFVSALPQRMLAHPQGGTLAVLGHVDRAWGTSFFWERSGQQLNVYESALDRLLRGYPIGAVAEFFNNRYAELGTALNEALENILLKGLASYDPAALASQWTACNDARGFIVIGDPAVRLNVATTPTPAPRSIDLSNLNSVVPVTASKPTLGIDSTLLTTFSQIKARLADPEAQIARISNDPEQLNEMQQAAERLLQLLRKHSEEG
jgi:hypothetical protein